MFGLGGTLLLMLGQSRFPQRNNICSQTNSPKQLSPVIA